MSKRKIVIVGGGPAGLAAAEWLSGSGYDVDIHEAMPTIGRKFLLAGKSGLNLTHSEPHERFEQRYGASAQRLRMALDRFGSDQVRRWADGLGAETFVGTSGRVFPKAMKASPLLRAWRARLEAQGVRIHVRHRWTGFRDRLAVFDTPDGPLAVEHDALLLALGGASWPKLGSDGSWVPLLADRGVVLKPLLPANCGFDMNWTPYFSDRFAGAPVKSVVATSSAGTSRGEFVITRHGIEGSLVYGHASALRDDLLAGRRGEFVLDLVPDRSADALAAALRRTDPKASFSNRLRKATGLDGVKAALVREFVDDDVRRDPEHLATAIKSLRLPLVRPRPIDEAISTAGGVAWEAVDGNFMLKGWPGVFAAGEMLDWEAPTGGYLLTACLATGRAAAEGMARWLSGSGA
ncbi:TIGR03862 family flavoprotein [Ciceribacter sp. L1K23]|uniref:TIGR03862 family flavoprotein n=1 Tax=Ciceribacter sp. L1K23 TaxID=2820276 RepID=UPI001B826120|nr:TIGR03862 family flavoprotein [Ciceribacter sp. L1K23]MBR0557770.1 TIGR03862 family flavoprotein [Ciceribacter sp. L1K23]